MDIIILKGESNSGKTLTLNYLIHRLMSIASPEIIIEIQTNTTVSTIRSIQDIKCMEIDRKAIFICNNSKRVGIYTAGDDLKNINDAILFFQQTQCDIGIMALNTQKNGLKNCLNTKMQGNNSIVVKTKKINNNVSIPNANAWNELTKELTKLGLII